MSIVLAGRRRWFIGTQPKLNTTTRGPAGARIQRFGYCEQHEPGTPLAGMPAEQNGSAETLIRAAIRPIGTPPDLAQEMHDRGCRRPLSLEHLAESGGVTLLRQIDGVLVFEPAPDNDADHTWSRIRSVLDGD
jgi:hypothetical protein